jgi:hypothetical protein
MKSKMGVAGNCQVTLVTHLQLKSYSKPKTQSLEDSGKGSG